MGVSFAMARNVTASLRRENAPGTLPVGAV